MKSLNWKLLLIVGILGLSLLGYGALLYTQSGEEELFLATTTSVENTGLLDFLIDEFTKTHDLNVKYTAVGSGAAIQLGRDGEVDALIVHAPDLELELVNEGLVEKRTTLWYNYFMIIGPSDDPAGVGNATNPTEVMTNLYQAGENGEATFYSRGDESGTHQKEKALWDTANLNPDPESDWYFETGTGMSATIVTANDDVMGYTLTDIGTFAKLISEDEAIEMVTLYDQDEALYNPYSYLILDSDQFDDAELNQKGAQEFHDFLNSEKGKNLVKEYRVGETVLFNPVEN